MSVEDSILPARVGLAGLALIVVVYLGLGLAYALATPIWQAPDEPAHFNYVRGLAQGQGLPVLVVGDYDHDYLERLKGAKFPAEMPVDSLRYESHQPPLYYLLATPIHWLTSALPLSAQVVGLRLFTLLLGVPLIVVAYLIVGEVFPGRPLLALGAAGFPTLLPQHLAVAASVNNDLAAELVVSLLLLFMLRRLPSPQPDRVGVLGLGLLLGLALLTKTTIYFALLLPPLALLLGRAGLGVYLRLGIVYGVALGLSGWWFVRNALAYGGLDLFGWARHDLVVAGQPQTGAFDLAAARHFLVTTFQSFWVQLGWMGVPAERRIYLGLVVFTALVFLGLLLFLWRQLRGRDRLSPSQWAGLGLLFGVLALTVVAMFLYNLRFIQPQGRYLFAAIVPIGLFFALGLRELAPRRYFPLVLALAAVLGLYLNYYSLTVLMPYLS